MKSILFVSTVGAALAFTAPSQAADGLGILLGGGGWRVPTCAAPKVLREVRDQQTGKLVWRCVTPSARSAQVVLSPRR